MLILSRHKDESIILTVPPSDKPTRIEVVVTKINGAIVRLGISAPIEVRAMRNELIDQPVDYDSITLNKIPVDKTHIPLHSSFTPGSSTKDIIRKMREKQ